MDKPDGSVESKEKEKNALLSSSYASINTADSQCSGSSGMIVDDNVGRRVMTFRNTRSTRQLFCNPVPVKITANDIDTDDNGGDTSVQVSVTDDHYYFGGDNSNEWERSVSALMDMKLDIDTIDRFLNTDTWKSNILENVLVSRRISNVI
jgi:hypothetical protein